MRFWLPIRIRPPIPPLTSSKGYYDGMHVGGSGWSASRRITGLSSPTASPMTGGISPTLFEVMIAELGIGHKLIRPYPPRHNGKVKCSHSEDQKRFYSLNNFAKQLAIHNRRSNNFSMRPPGGFSPSEFTVHYVPKPTIFTFRHVLTPFLTFRTSCLII